jgi:hypothetical protein
MIRSNETPAVTMKIVTDPEELARAREQRERFDRNWNWFKGHAKSLCEKSHLAWKMPRKDEFSHRLLGGLCRFECTLSNFLQQPFFGGPHPEERYVTIHRTGGATLPSECANGR